MLAWRSAFEFLNLVRCPRLHTTTLVAIRQSGLEIFALSDLSALTSDLRPLTADVRPLTSVLWLCSSPAPSSLLPVLSDKSERCSWACAKMRTNRIFPAQLVQTRLV
jgi:hypothetical protein